MKLKNHFEYFENLKNGIEVFSLNDFAKMILTNIKNQLVFNSKIYKLKLIMSKDKNNIYQEKRASLENYVTEQIIGPGAYHNKYFY